MSKNKKKIQFALVFCSFVLPSFILYSFFVVYPLVNTVSISFFRWNIRRDILNFVGFQNYIDMFTNDPAFIQSIIFTVRYAVIMIVLLNVVALLLAASIESGIRGRNVVRNMFFIPNVMSGIIVAFVWRFMFMALYPEMITFLRLPESWDVSWFATGDMAFYAIIIVAFWQGLGFNIILYIAGLQMVPSDLYESAEIDGASAFQRLTRITIPMIAPTITINLFVSINGTFRLFDIPMGLTGGGPMRMTESLALNIYMTAFDLNELGAASARSVFLLVLVLICASIQIYFTSKREVSL